VSRNTDNVELREINRKLDELRGMVLVLAAQITGSARPYLDNVKTPVEQSRKVSKSKTPK
jgi:hypothetical protein